MFKTALSSQRFAPTVELQLFMLFLVLLIELRSLQNVFLFDILCDQVGVIACSEPKKHKEVWQIQKAVD